MARTYIFRPSTSFFLICTNLLMYLQRSIQVYQEMHNKDLVKMVELMKISVVMISDPYYYCSCFPSFKDTTHNTEKKELVEYEI